MRILITVDPEIPVPPKLYGGIERIAHGLIVALRERGHRVGLMAHRDSRSPADFFQPWPGAKSNRIWCTLHNVSALVKGVRRFQPDVIHSFSRLAYLLPLLPSRIGKVMCYQRHTGGWRISAASFLGSSRLVFAACSSFIANQGRGWGGRWEVIPNFVDVNVYGFREAVAADAPLVFLSRLERIKGVHNAIAIAKRAGKRLIIAGNRGGDPEACAYWDREIAPYIGRDGIEYVGPVDDSQKNALLGSAAALVVPIEWEEPFGIVFIESLACGTPAISAPRGALPEIIRHGVNGFLVRSVEEGVAAVKNLGTISRAACRQVAENLFSSRVVSRQYEALYRSLSSQSEKG